MVISRIFADKRLFPIPTSLHFWKERKLFFNKQFIQFLDNFLGGLYNPNSVICLRFDNF